MKVQRKLGINTIVEAEAPTPAELFDALAMLEEIFRPRPCGLCKGAAVTFTMRQDREGNKYRQAQCTGCGAEFRFGLRKGPGGLLFPQANSKHGHKDNGGWSKFEPHPKQPDEPALDDPF
jgi:hypothetical protein